MSFVIDGYNLLNATGIPSRGKGPGNLERARQALLNTLVESLPPEEVPRTRLPGPLPRDGLPVAFSRL